MYGREPESMDKVLRGFLFVLGEYPIDVVSEAMRQHMKQSRDFPTPADIEAIINPVEEPPCHALYIDIMKKVSQGDHLWGDDKDFVTKYRKYWMGKALADEKKRYTELSEKLRIT